MFLNIEQVPKLLWTKNALLTYVVCGKQTVHLKFDEDSYRLVHYCEDAKCPSNGVLPRYMVDYEIYRYLPSAIISTVDKLAILGNISEL